jgi:hypothetical protein
MAITLDAVSLATCEATTGWTAIGSAAELAVSDAYDSREGTNCLEYGCPADTAHHGYQSPAFTAFDVTTREFGVWFLIPKASNDESQILGSASDALRIRLYDASSNWAEWDLGGNDDFIGGWNFLRVSGNTPDRTSATAPTYTAITQAAVLTNNAGANNGKQSNGDAYYGIDWMHSYTKITVTAGTALAPNDPDDIVTAADTKPYWGQIVKDETFFTLRAALEIGDGTTSTYFAAENEQMQWDPFDNDVPYEIRVKNNGDWRTGLKNVQTDDTYAQNGCTIRHGSKGTADIIVESGGVFKAYATKIEGWKTINLGSGGAGVIELIKVDIYDNTTLELRSTSLEFTDVRIHFPDGSEASAGAVYADPDIFKKVSVFQTTDALEWRDSSTGIEEYWAGDNTYDFTVLEGKFLSVVNSVFSATKLKRVAS